MISLTFSFLHCGAALTRGVAIQTFGSRDCGRGDASVAGKIPPYPIYLGCFDRGRGIVPCDKSTYHKA